MQKWGEKSVILLGAGAAGADCAALMEMGVPVLTSWQAIDLVDNYHPAYFGRTGLYGQRCANKVLYNADFVLSIGCRMSIFSVGYGDKPYAPGARIVMVDIDEAELANHPEAVGVCEDALAFVDRIKGERPAGAAWMNQCRYWAETMPWVESPAHDDNGFINSYRFMERINSLFRPDEIITVDVGGAACSAFQTLRLRPPQKLLSSGGLGEMGCALPAAVGASFAAGRGHVVCLVGDGGLMLNLQELQTIAHHQLPIKVIVLCNNGYGMIKWTQQFAGFQRANVDRASGVSFPDFKNLAFGFGLGGVEVRTWEDFDRVMPWFLHSNEPAICAVYLDPEQAYVPRMAPVRLPDGSFGSPSFDDLSPRLPC